MSVDFGQTRPYIFIKNTFSNVWTLHNPPPCLYLRLTSTHAASYKTLIKTRHHSVSRKEGKGAQKMPKSYLCSWLRSSWIRLENSGLKKLINWLERSQTTGIFPSLPSPHELWRRHSFRFASESGNLMAILFMLLSDRVIGFMPILRSTTPYVTSTSRILRSKLT